MKTPRLLLFLFGLLLSSLAVRGQNAPVVLQAEAGTLRAASTPPAINFLTEAGTGTGYIQVAEDLVRGENNSAASPNADSRVLTYTITFPGSGVYDLYARARVGSRGFDDDSYYLPNSFGTRPAADASRWIIANGLAGGGYSTATDIVSTDGPGGANNVWRWFRMSAFGGGGTFTVPAGNLTQTFEIGSRENGLDIDKFVFGASGVFFTVANLDNGQQGSTTPPPPPFTPPGPPIATGKPKFVGGAFSNAQKVNFNKYWNQVVSENDGKWGSVEATRDVMNWAGLDSAYNQAKRQNVPFRMHVLVWGNQQPAWIENLPPAEQLEEIKEWFAAVAQRYPDIAFLEVVNEPTNDPPRKTSPTDQGSGNYIEALGGSGATGWDWVINSFKLAREYFPNTLLMLNDYSVVNVTSNTQRYLGIINLLKQQNLIDAVGIQGHAFSTRGPAATQISNLDLLATTGLPLYVTEFDVDGLQDEVQLAEYQRVFPLFYKHPAVKGITLWGYRPGHWRTAQGAYIAFENGAERPALKWLREYVQGTTLSTITTASTLAATTFCGGSTVNVPFSVDGAVAANQTFTAELSDASGSFAAPTAIGTATASAAGSYSVMATIPANTPEGVLYRIRVTSSNPSVLGNANNANLTINPVFTAPELVVTPTSNTYTGGVPTNMYLGYGPQSVTLTASGGASYAWTGAAGLSSTSAANPVFTATEAGTFTFTVTITNEAGCTATKQVTLTVVDARCGNDKVLVCLNGKVICVAKNAVPALLKYTKGIVRLGDCTTGTDADLSALKEKLVRLFEAYPNPFSGRTTLRFRSTESGQAQLQVYNQFGQLVATPFNGVAEGGREYEITLDGSSLPDGIYTGRLLTDGKVEILRLMIAK